MNPQIKTVLVIISSLLGIFIFPFILVVFHEYVMAFLAIFFFIATFLVFIQGMFDQLYPELKKKYIEEEDIIHQFHGDKQKIKFYKGFKKYFEGSLSKEGLEKWLEHHH